MALHSVDITPKDENGESLVVTRLLVLGDVEKFDKGMAETWEFLSQLYFGEDDADSSNN